MKKLSQLKAEFTPEKCKRYLKNGVQIGLIGAALTAGSLFTNHWAKQPRPQDTVIVNDNHQHNLIIGNGNYFFHDYVNSQTLNTADGIKHCLAFAQIYNRDQAHNFETSFAKRPNVAQYFAPYTQVLQAQNADLDRLIPTRQAASYQIFRDVLQSLPTENEQFAFCNCYEILSNEAYQNGFGDGHQVPTAMTNRYQNNKFLVANYIQASLYDGLEAFAAIDLDAEYGANHFRGVTNLLDQLLHTATTNLNQNPRLGLQGQLQVADLRHVLNQSFANYALIALHDLTAATTQHTDCRIHNAVPNLHTVWLNLLQQQTENTREN